MTGRHPDTQMVMREIVYKINHFSIKCHAKVVSKLRMCSLFRSCLFCQSELSFNYLQARCEECVNEGTKGTQWQLRSDAGAAHPAGEMNDTPYWIEIDMVSFIMFWRLLVMLLIFITVTLKYTCPRLWTSAGMAAHTHTHTHTLSAALA